MSDEEMCDGRSEYPSEKLKTMRITAVDDEEDEDEPADGAAATEDVYEDDDSYDDDEEECQQSAVSLGFLESPKHSWSLNRELFPSIAGGTPAWLDPVNLPSGTSCLCDFCGLPLWFLLQVYAPLQQESTFHRVLFVFMCPSMACLLKDQHNQWKQEPDKASRSVKVFRCQMPRINSFYSSEPPRNNGSDRPSQTGAVLCSWCGTWRGDKICGNCRRVRYCSEKHQTAHWRAGHKLECRQSCIARVASETTTNSTTAEIRKVASNHVWPKFEIVQGGECETQKSVYDGFDKSLVSQSQMNETVKSLIDAFEVAGDKETWASFQERISRDPEQVLRYYGSVRAKPLWPMASGQPSKTDIPRCYYCSGPRACEFQVLPQLLFYFGVENNPDSLDWATIAVYTCEDSCDEGTVYREEFAWVQLSSQSTTM